MAGTDNFGTSFINSSDVLLYIVQRIAVYCQAIVHGKANDLFTMHKKEFEDCENLRYSCNLANSYDCSKSLP